MEKLESVLSYETQGFVHLPGILEPAFLARMKAAFDRAIAKHAEKWLAAGEAATPSFDLPHILDEDDVFVDLVDLPTVFPLLVEIHRSGQNISSGPDIRPSVALRSGWGPRNQSWDEPPFHGQDPLLSGRLDSRAGCLVFIPGSHRYSIGTPRPRIPYRQDSPLFKKIVPKAGDGVLFNPHIFHMCLDNLSAYVRKSLIYTYGHFWMKNYPSAVPTHLERVATTHQRKQLFGLRTGSRGDHFDQSLLNQSMTKEVDGLLESGRKLLSKAKQLYFIKPSNQ